MYLCVCCVLRTIFIVAFQDCLHQSTARVSLVSSPTLATAFLHHSQHKECLFFFIFIIRHCRSQPILHTPCWENKETFFEWHKFFPLSSAVFCLQIICVCWTNFFESPNHLELLLFPIQSGLFHWNLDVFHMKSHQDHTTPFPDLTSYAKINVLADIFKFLFLIIIPPIDVYQIKARLLQR